MLYWDTSALVKQFIDEPGTDQALFLRAHAAYRRIRQRQMPTPEDRPSRRKQILVGKK